MVLLHKNNVRSLLELSIYNVRSICYYIFVRQSKETLKKGSEEMEEMTTAELNQYLENIAKLIEATAETKEDAAKIVRDSKVKA